MDNQQKREYRAPRLIEHGRVEDITRGLWGPHPDFLFGNLSGGGSGGHSST